MSYVELNPEPAAGAARATADTQPVWDGWASGSVSALHDAAAESRESIVTAAFGSYADEISPKLRSIAHQVGRQAANLATAVDTAVDSDIDAGAGQQPAQQTTSDMQTMVNRPINVG